MCVCVCEGGPRCVWRGGAVCGGVQMWFGRRGTNKPGAEVNGAQRAWGGPKPEGLTKKVITQKVKGQFRTDS